MLTTAVGAPWPVSGLSVASVHSHAGVTARGPPEKRGWGISTHCSDFGGGVPNYEQILFLFVF